MAAEPVFEQLWNELITQEWLDEGGSSPAMTKLAATTAASFRALATEVDRLRGELVAKGLLESAQPIV